MPKTNEQRSTDAIEKQAQALYHAQTRAQTGAALSWGDASEEVKDRYRAAANEQRRSFVYGNCAVENPTVTRELVDKVADDMDRE